MKVDQQELAELFGVSPRTIRNWQADGMPVEGQRNGRKIYEAADCISWRVEQARAKARRAAADVEAEGLPTKQESQRRRAAVRAREAELDLAEREERIVDRAAFREVLSELLSVLRRAILNVPGRWAAQLVGLNSPREAEKVLRRMARDLLRHLSGPVADAVETGGAAELPDDFPGAEALRASGVVTVPELLELDDVQAVDGIGPARAEAIRDRLREEGLEAPGPNGRDDG